MKFILVKEFIQMLTFDFTYLFFNAVLLFTFFYYGRKIAKGANYWKNALVCIMVYVFVLGARYGRGNDYFHYLSVYKVGLGYEQVLFEWINDFLKWMGVGAHYIFFYYAFVFIVCAMIFLKPYRKYMAYMLPIFLIATLQLEEYQIRQALSYSFVFLYTWKLVEKNSKRKTIFGMNARHIWLALFFLLATAIHIANSLIIVVITFFYLFLHRLIPLYVSIPVYLVAVYVLSTYADLSFLEKILSFLSRQNERFAQYVERSDIWFSSEGYKTKYVRQNIVMVFEALGNISLFYFSAKTIKKACNEKWAILMTNMYIFGTIFRQAFIRLELMNRMGNNMMLFFFVPLSIVLYYYKKMKYNFFEKVCFVFLIFWVYDYLKMMLMRDVEKMLFLWDYSTYQYFENVYDL